MESLKKAFDSRLTTVSIAKYMLDFFAGVWKIRVYIYIF